MSEVILEMRGITKSFQGVHALKGVDFVLKKNEIHALLGENGAGKSTLMKILLGIQPYDSGEIIYRGEAVKFSSPADGLKHGISMIHQETSLVPQLTVAENIWMGQEKSFSSAGIVNIKKRAAKTRALLKELDIDIDINKKIIDLTVAQMQLVELARAITVNPSVIIMDEPTSALSRKEIETFFSIVKKLSAEGISIIFISHKLDEVFEICNVATILRDGQLIGSYQCSELNEDNLIQMIAGRKLADSHRNKQEYGKEILSVEHLSGDAFSDISFRVRGGEVIGFYGLMGAGRSEIARAVFGIDRYKEGVIKIEGKPVAIHSPKDGVKNGIGMVTEDRLRMGCLYNFSVVENMSMVVLRKLCSRLGFLNRKAEMGFFDEGSRRMEVKYGSTHSKIGELSGGNQQKVIIARCVMANPKVLIMDEPTRGIDVGSKSEIYDLIDSLAKEGLAVVLISSELPEILALCDKIHVVREGKINYICDREEAVQEEIVKYAFGIADSKREGVKCDE